MLLVVVNITPSSSKMTGSKAKMHHQNGSARCQFREAMLKNSVFIFDMVLLLRNVRSDALERAED